MQKSVSRSFLIILSFLPVLCFGFSRPICRTQECAHAGQILKESLNNNVDPCDNFYLYACGNWTKVHINRSFWPRSVFTLRSEENDKEILDFLKKGNNPSEPEAIHKARRFFSLCLNENAYVDRMQKIQDILNEIGVRVIQFTEDKKFDYTTALVRASRIAGINIYFDLGVDCNPYNRTMHMIGLKRPKPKMDDSVTKLLTEKSLGSQTSYGKEQLRKRHFISEVVHTMCRNNTQVLCSPDTPELSETTPQNWLIDQLDDNTNEFFTFMKISSMLPRMNPLIETLYHLQATSDQIADEEGTQIPKLNWTRYIEEMFYDIHNVTLDLRDTISVRLVVEDYNYVKNMLKFIYGVRKDMMSIEWDIWWQVVSELLPYVDLKISDAKNNMGASEEHYSTSKNGREKRCAKLTTALFGVAINYGYSTKEKFRNAKTKIENITEYIRASLEHMICESSWIDEQTKQKALIKLHSLKANIVYPDINDTNSLDELYRDIQITDNLFDTMISNIQIQVNKTLNSLERPNDLNKERTFSSWTSPGNVNGFYDQIRNTLTIPAGLIGGSIYSDSLRALDYGAIGSIIGHEFIHAFDETGRRHNEIGNVERWWQHDSSKLYKEKAQCFIKAYASYNITINDYILKVNSTRSSEEDIADNAAFKLSLYAYRKSQSELGKSESLLPHFFNLTQEQQLTVAYANVFCESPTAASLILNGFENHSPDGVRVNGVFKNSVEFSEIWNCPKGSNMNPRDKCSVW